jgi:hypothetical protein
MLEQPGAVALAPAVTVALPQDSADMNQTCSHILRGLLSGLDESERVVIADGDAAWIGQLAPTTREVGARLLWWQRPGCATEALPGDRIPSDGILVTMPSAATNDTPARWVIGAGIDMNTCCGRPAPRARSPLQLVHCSQHAPSDQVDVVLRAVASSRGRGLNARLTVWATDPSVASDPVRIERAADDLALGESVEFRDGPLTADTVADFHAVLDTSTTEGVDRALLEAMACGVPVVSSNAEIESLLDVAPIPLRYRESDVPALSERILMLSRVWTEQLAALGEALRSAVASEHSLDVWADRLVAVVDHRELPAAVRPSATPSAAVAALAKSDPTPAQVVLPRLPRQRRSFRAGGAIVGAGLAIGTAVVVIALARGGERVVTPGVQVSTPSAVTVAPPTRPVTSPAAAGTEPAASTPTDSPRGSASASPGTRRSPSTSSPSPRPGAAAVAASPGPTAPLPPPTAPPPTEPPPTEPPPTEPPPTEPPPTEPPPTTPTTEPPTTEPPTTAPATTSIGQLRPDPASPSAQ